MARFTATKCDRCEKVKEHCAIRGPEDYYRIRFSYTPMHDDLKSKFRYAEVCESCRDIIVDALTSALP